MINVSDAFKQKLQDGEKVWQEVEITFPDGTVKTVKDEIMGENCTFSDCAESSSFPIGCVVCKSITLELDNSQDQWKNYYFYQAKVHAYLKMQIDASTVETIDKGVYTITTPEQYGEILSFTTLDDMYKTNATYISHLVLPQSIEALVRDACETLSIPSEVSMTHGNLVVSEIPENMTFRQLFGWAAMLETANARLDNRGYLRFIRWDFSNVQEDYNAVADADGNLRFKGGASIDSENFISPVGNWTIDNDGFLTLIESATDTSEKLKDFFESPTVSSDDIVITGIKLKNRENEAMYGNTGYVLELENDLVADSDLDTVAAQIGDSIIGVKFRSMSGELAYNPLIEFGDMAYTYDRRWNRYITPLTDVSCSANGETTVKTQADDPIRGMSKFVSDGTKAIAEARRLVKKEQSAREEAVKRLENTLKGSSGLYETSVTQEDGSIITYLHDKPTLTESKNVIKFTAEAIGISNDGGKTYPYGIVLDGTFIANQLYSVGISADYITTGNFQIVDESGKVLFSADKDLKRVYFDASNVFIGENSITKRIEDLQNQTDGNIQTWTSSPEPTLDNYPANQWLTDDERSKHVGDIYYDSNNQAYRFRYDSEGYNWKMLKDTDVTKALQDAEAAKKQAENAEKVAALAKNVTLQLSNDYATVSVDSEGNYDKFPDVSIKPIVMYGSSNITTECIYNVLKSDSVSGSWNSNTLTYTLTGLSANSGWVDIRATYLGTLSVTKRFNISKLYAGEKGEKGDTSTSVFLSASNTVVRKMARNVLMPSTISFTSYYLDGSTAQKPYDVIFSIEESENGEVWKEVYRSTSTESIVHHCLYTILSGKDNIALQDAGEGTIIATARQISVIRCSIYTVGNELIDTQNISVVTDATALTQQEIVEILSDDGYWKGLYYLNGRLYISFDAALGGALTLGGENNGNGLLKIRDAEGNDIGYIDNTGVHFNHGEFSGKVHASQIDGSKVTGSTFLSDNRKTATKVEAGTVRFRNVELDENAYVEDEETGEMIYVGAEDADWSSESDIANAGYMQTSSRYYPDFASSDVTVEENVAAMELNAFWGLFVRAEKSDIASFGKNLVKLFGRTEIQGDTNIAGDVEVLNGNGQVHCNTLWTKYLQVDSTKSRLVDTQNYQKQYMHAFETPAPMFGDVGSSCLNESGEDFVPIDDIFLETINAGIEYQVFLQKEGQGDIWVESKMPLYFVVKGTPELKYSWEIKAVQRDYEHIRWDDMTVIALDTDLVEYDTYMINLQEEDLKDMDEMERLLLAEAERSELASKQ